MARRPRREHTHLALAADRTEAQHWDAELDASTVSHFHEVLARRGLDPEEYTWFPVHPWQWQHRIAVTFAPDLGRQDLVDLGEGPDDHQPQQSIRTAFNRSRPRGPTSRRRSPCRTWASSGACRRRTCGRHRR